MWHPLTIKRIATNQTYTGKTYFGKTKRIANNKVASRPQEDWILLPNITPPIISEDMFKRAQDALLLAKQSRPIKQNSSYLLTGFMKCNKCGSPIGGTTLSGRYRYYQCRGARPTSTRGKICDAGYIRANELEESVWDKILEMLSSPLTLLRTLTEENQKQPEKVVAVLNKQIDQLRKKLKTYPSKERKLYDLLAHEAVTKDYVLDVVNKLKQERLNDERQLESLRVSRKEAAQADHLRLRLSDFSFNKLSDLIYENEWRGFDPFIDPKGEEPPYLDQDQLIEQLARKRSLLESIRLKILADPKGYQFNFTLDGQIISTADTNELSSFNDELKRFEDKHPNVSVKDLLDTIKLLPEDTPFAQKVSQLKQNLVTIEQTSA